MAGLEGMRLGSCLVKRHIGDGGIGDVYLGEQPELGRLVAVKVVRRELDPGASEAAATYVTQQFSQEARVIASLEHPNILPIFEFGEQNGLHYLIMPYVPDGSLEDILVPGRQHRLDLPLPPTLASSVIDQAADALQYAHDHGIVHRDVKPHNLLVRFLPAPSGPSRPIAGPGAPPLSPGAAQADPGPSGPVYLHILLADFGLARFMSAISSQTHTTGTPMYTAPEQYAGQPGPATDQYALACIAYLLLTGQPVFGGTAAELYHQHLSQLPALARTRNPVLPPAVDPILARALLKDPAQRYPRVRDFAAALHVAIDPSVQMQQPGGWPRAATAGPAVGPAAPGAPAVPPAGWTPQPTNPWAAQAAPAAPAAPAGSGGPAVWQTGPGQQGPGSPPVAAPPLSASPLATPLSASLLRPPVPPAAPPFQTFSTSPTGGAGLVGHAGQVGPQRDAPGARIPGKGRNGVSRRAVLLAGAGLAVAAAGASGFVWYTRAQRLVHQTPPPPRRVPDTLGYWRPSMHAFYLATSLSHPVPTLVISLGRPESLPVVGDWNGDGIDTGGYFRPRDATFFLWEWNASGEQVQLAHSVTLGSPGDMPIAGDWTGSGRDGVGVYRPSTSVFYLKNSLTSGPPDYTMAFGQPNDIPLVGDWVGDGIDRVGAFRPSTATFYLAGRACNCGAPDIYSFPWGQQGDVPFAGEWTASGRSGIGLFRPFAGTMYLLNDVTHPGVPDASVFFGQPGDLPLAGRWQ